MAAYSNEAFFKEALVYQVYPASFCDSNGDGFGDLNGIRSKLDYLQSFGVDVLWLNPIYKSPFIDMGYDISDYKAIDPRYGTLDDWDGLVTDLHSRSMKIIMDLVVNYTSNQHEWFLESRSSKTNSKREWYIWRPAKYNAKGERVMPNNWESHFGGSVWQWDEKTQEYYLHLYALEQPDLNWDNSDVREAVWDLMLWWLKRGTDGFRMDTINLISKRPDLPDASVKNPDAKYQRGYEHYVNGPHVHEIIQEMYHRVLSQYPNCLRVGETSYSYDATELVKYVQPHRNELQMVFQFENIDIDKHPTKPITPRPFTLPDLKALIEKWQCYMYEHDGWNTVFFENHDLARSISRMLGIRDPNDPLRSQGAKLLAMLQTTLGGTCFVFQGQELGMGNIPASWRIEEYKDVATQNAYKAAFGRRRRESGNAEPDMSDIMEGINKKARDNARTPMQWTSEPYAGFTHGASKPWMRVNDDYRSWNAHLQVDDPQSIMSFWKRAIEIRKSNKVLTYGDFTLLSAEHPRIFAYLRRQRTSAVCLVVLNFSREEVTYTTNMPDIGDELHLVLCNVENKSDAPIVQPKTDITLCPFEGRIYLISKPL